MGDCLDLDLPPRQREVHEAVGVVLAENVRLVLRGDASAASRNYPGGRAECIPGLHVVHLLQMHVAGDEQVDAILLRKRQPRLLAPRRREVRDNHLPIHFGMGQALFDPLDLVLPQPQEPIRAILDRARALLAARRMRAVVRPRTDVVVLVVAARGVEHVRVDEPIVDGKARVAHGRPPELRRRHPTSCARSARRPCVADRLVPAGLEEEATVVVVAQDAQPDLAVDAWPRVDLLEDEPPLAGAVPHAPWRSAALHLDTSPVEVIADIEDVVGLVLRGSLAHLLRDAMLGDVVGAGDEVTLAFSIIRRPREGASAAPVAYDEDVVGPVRGDADVRHGHAVELRGQLADFGRHEPVVAHAVVRLFPVRPLPGGLRLLALRRIRLRNGR
mmetsp:Transcript_37238/g.107529  ORF Transcript_37238/g.107529 Transcript_37238/m.107529 type:complete len:387 (+) Transcript_37238:197-1357(+)